MTHGAKDRLEHYASEWIDDTIRFDRLCIWAVIMVMLVVQVLTTGLAFEAHGVGSEASAAMGTAFELLMMLVFAAMVRADSVFASIVTEAAYHLGYVDFDVDEETDRLEEVWGVA